MAYVNGIIMASSNALAPVSYTHLLRMVVFEKPHALTDAPLHYCPGCTHGIVHRLVAEAIDTLGIEGKTIGIAPVGCSVMAYNYFSCDMIEAAHGLSLIHI